MAFTASECERKRQNDISSGSRKQTNMLFPTFRWRFTISRAFHLNNRVDCAPSALRAWFTRLAQDRANS